MDTSIRPRSFKYEDSEELQRVLAIKDLTECETYILITLHPEDCRVSTRVGFFASPEAISIMLHALEEHFKNARAQSDTLDKAKKLLDDKGDKGEKEI